MFHQSALYQGMASAVPKMLVNQRNLVGMGFNPSIDPLPEGGRGFIPGINLSTF